MKLGSDLLESQHLVNLFFQHEKSKLHVSAQQHKQ